MLNILKSISSKSFVSFDELIYLIESDHITSHTNDESHVDTLGYSIHELSFNDGSKKTVLCKVI